ncbi:MAG: hypothetical protein QME89_05355 [Actinomycetota bacterium]|nr:hypothetical protein [Actinomycetota bacterium]MDI7251969.1 hypothetical protein [Actinomycetota bacterium]
MRVGVEGGTAISGRGRRSPNRIPAGRGRLGVREISRVLENVGSAVPARDRARR